MEARHAKGPWRINERGDIVADYPVPGVRGSDDVEYYGGHLVAESVAPQNRPIVAAAPDLYEALKAVLDEFKDFLTYEMECDCGANHERGAGFDFARFPSVADANAAIAKSEGM